MEADRNSLQIRDVPAPSGMETGAAIPEGGIRGAIEIGITGDRNGVVEKRDMSPELFGERNKIGANCGQRNNRLARIESRPQTRFCFLGMPFHAFNQMSPRTPRKRRP